MADTLRFAPPTWSRLKNFAFCLGLSNRIGVPQISGQYAKRPCYRLQFSDVKFFRWLQLIGITPAKSLTIGRLNIPDQFFRDFLRGHLDGDGTITTYTDNYNVFKNQQYEYYRIMVRFISASKTHLEWIRETIIRLISIDGDFFMDKGRAKNPIWQLKFMKNDSIHLLRWIYYSEIIPCLSRKREKARMAIAKIAAIKRKEYERNVILL